MRRGGGLTVRRTAGHGIEVADAERVSISETTIENPGRLGEVAVGRYGIGLRHLREVAVQQTAVESESDETSGFGWQVNVDGLETSGNTLRVSGESREPTFTTL